MRGRRMKGRAQNGTVKVHGTPGGRVGTIAVPWALDGERILKRWS